MRGMTQPAQHRHHFKTVTGGMACECGETLSAVSTQTPAPVDHRGTALDPELAAYLDWPLYFLDESVQCNKFPGCTNADCGDGDGPWYIPTGRRMTAREFLADIKAHAEAGTTHRPD